MPRGRVANVGFAAKDVRELRIQTHESPEETVLVLEGELDIASTPRLTEELERVPAGSSRIVIDLRKVTFLDSTGLRALVAASDQVERWGRSFALVRGPQQVDRLLNLTRVSERLTILEEPAASSE